MMRNLPTRATLTWSEFISNIIAFFKTGKYVVYRSASYGRIRVRNDADDEESGLLSDHYEPLHDTPHTTSASRYRAGSFDIEMNSNIHGSYSNSHGGSSGANPPIPLRAEYMRDR
jgi:hypothetical protein